MAFSRVRIARVRTMGNPKSQNPDPKAQRKSQPVWDSGIGIWDLLSLPGSLFHTRGLALQVAQEVELGAADAGRPHQVDLGDRRRMKREDALDALAERHLAHRERGAGAAAMQPDHDPLEDLDALLVALAHLYVHADGVARLHVGALRRHLRFL